MTVVVGLRFQGLVATRPNTLWSLMIVDPSILLMDVHLSTHGRSNVETHSFLVDLLGLHARRLLLLSLIARFSVVAHHAIRIGVLTRQD